MDFRELLHQNSQFSMDEMELEVSFCTQTSVSFSIHIGVKRGWVDLHFPCEGHIKVQVRGAFPTHYLEPSKILRFIPLLFDHLGIATDETYEAVFFAPSQAIQTGQAVNREGMTDRIETTRSNKPPWRLG